MFCSFDENPLILRIYGKGKCILPNQPEWQNEISQFEDMAGARQIITVDIDLVQTSCGFGVPLMDFICDRDLLPKWATAKGHKGIQDYWKEKNSTSLDGKSIQIL